MNKRITVLCVTGVETALWLYLALGGVTDSLPFAKGYGEFVALLSTVVYVTFVLPALVLAAVNRALYVASWLSSVGAILYLYDPLLRITAVLGGLSFVGLFLMGVLGAVLAAGYGVTKRRTARGF